MASHHDRLTLAALLSDPLTQLVMLSDGITSVEVERAFAIARTGLAAKPMPAGCTAFDRCLGQDVFTRLG